MALRALSLENPMRSPISSCVIPLASAARRSFSRTADTVGSYACLALAIRSVYISVGNKATLVGIGGDRFHVILIYFSSLLDEGRLVENFP